MRIKALLSMGLFTGIVLLGAAPVGAQTFACSDFTTREEAQSVLQGNPSTAAALDPDRNGLACDTTATRAPAAAVPARRAPVRAPVSRVEVVRATARRPATARPATLARTGSDLTPAGLAAIAMGLGALAVVWANRSVPAGPWDILPRRRLPSLFR